MVTIRAKVALLVVLSPAACGGDVRNGPTGPRLENEEASAGDAGGVEDVASGGPDTATQDAQPDTCAPENTPICSTLRERVVRTHLGECALYVPHSSTDPRPFDPSVFAIQVGTAGGPRQLTRVADEPGCSVESPSGVLAWYFVSDPPRMVFCPVACSVIQTEADDIIEILLRCPTACPPP
jgi:hypothetical protein